MRREQRVSPFGPTNDAEAQATARDSARSKRSVIAAHLVLTLYGHWAVNDPRGSGSSEFIDPKFEPLGPIHQGRKSQSQQPSRQELRAFHREHETLLNFSLIWVDEAKAQAIAEAIEEVITARRYTCYACAICSNHVHLVIRTHKDKAPTMWERFAESIRTRLRLRFAPPGEISPHHPVISARPYNVLLYAPDEVRRRIAYVEDNPVKEGRSTQRWGFVRAYDGWPLHKWKES